LNRSVGNVIRSSIRMTGSLVPQRPRVMATPTPGPAASSIAGACGPCKRWATAERGRGNAERTATALTQRPPRTPRTGATSREPRRLDETAEPRAAQVSISVTKPTLWAIGVYRSTSAASVLMVMMSE